MYTVHPFTNETTRKPSSIKIIHLILLFHPARADTTLSRRIPHMPFTAHKSLPFAPISPSVYLLRVAHSLLYFPPFIYSLLPRLPFVTPSDSLFLTICLCLTYFRDMLGRASCAQVSYLLYVMHIVSPYLLDSIDYIINVQCFHYSVHYVPLRVFIFVCLSLIAAIYLFITSRCLKYAPLDILSLFFTLYSHLSSLTYFRTILLDRDRNFYSTPVLFSHSFKHVQILLPHAFP